MCLNANQLLPLNAKEYVMPQSHGPDLAPRITPTWLFTKVGKVGDKIFPTFLPRPSSDIATIHPNLAPHRSDLPRFSYDLTQLVPI
jgi:hypothetical protein